ncbi:MAG: thioredoxin family protein [Bacillota bacterium]|nr:thioredoxin family protein [Bacillota bacterium]
MIDMTNKDLNSLIKNNPTLLVYFYTPLCGTCQIASKMLRVVEHLTKLQIGMINANFAPDIARHFKIESVPCLLFLENGEKVDEIYAFHSVPYLLEKMKVLENQKP